MKWQTDKCFTIHRSSLSIKQISFIQFFLFHLFFHNITAQSSVFSVYPASIAGVDGSTVKFTCTANNTSLIDYRVNGTSASLQTIEEKGFDQQGTIMVDDVASRVLSVTVSSLYNNTEISCTDNLVTSNKAILTVQGPLSSVGNLSYSFINSSIVNISWIPPFTLPGTDITGYNISATSNETTTNYFTSDSCYVLLLTDITDSPCDEIIITVSGYNGLDGENESLTGIYLPSALIDTPVPISEFISSELQLSITLDFADLCVGQYPKGGIFILFTNGSLVNSTFNNIPSSKNFTIINLLMVEENTNYTLTATFSNLAGILNFNSTVTFITFSILSVNITDTIDDGRVCVECVFTSFSTDSGCTVELVSKNTLMQYTGTFSRSSTDSTVASGCISDVFPGVYTVRILNGKGIPLDISLLPSDITVTGSGITTPPTVATDESPDDMSGESPSNITVGSEDDENDNVGAIAGGVTAGVLLVILAGSGTVVLIVWKSSKNRKSADLGSSAVESQSCNKPSSLSKDDYSVHPRSVIDHQASTDSTKSLMHSPKKPAFDETIQEEQVILPDVINFEIEYAELNLKNQAKPGLPQQPVEYGEVDHNRTAQQQNYTSTSSPSPPVPPRSKDSHFLQ